MSDPPVLLSETEQEEVEAQSAPTAKVVHATVSRQGEDELDRPLASLLWSGVAAGVAIMASVSVSGALHHYLPEAPWREAVVALGYPVGFLIVILGGLQLFTEHTMVAVLPFARSPSVENLTRVLRLWSAVLAGNLVGAAAVTALSAFGAVQSPEMLEGMIAVSARIMERSALDTALQAIPAGFLIASVGWMRSASTDSGFAVVTVITYAIALCGFAHVIAGAAEAFLLMWTGHASLGWVITGFLLPALVGNIVGGTGLFAVLAHAQVREEL